MGRDIKFRAWNKEIKKMYEVIEIDFYNEKVGYLFADPTIQGEAVGYLKFSDIELMQSTGLKDKNSKEIYEGDILLGHSVSPECNVFEFKLIGEVYYSNRGTWDCYSYILGGFNEQVEVIGNIYENADLLEQII